MLALEAVTRAAPTRYAAYNVCSGSPVSIREVADLVTRGTGLDLTPVVTGEYRLGDVRHVVASPARAAAELGFEAAVLAARTGLAAFAHAPLR